MRRYTLSFFLRMGTIMTLCGVMAWLCMPMAAQARQPKPPVVPTDGKPAKYGPTPRKISVATLEFRLKHDRRLDGSHIRVTSDGHRVGLYGSVPNYHQRRIAHQIAQGMMGVTYVADHMRVISQPPAAAQLTSTVKARLAARSVTAGAPIRVKAYRDVVTLSGTVRTLRIKQAAIRTAHETPFVSVVQDHLKVPKGATGTTLAAQVRSALERDRHIHLRSLHVLAKGGHIYLRGAVFSRTAKQVAGDTAAGVPGVTGLSNSLTVLPASLR